MRQRLALLAEVGRQAVSVPDRAAHALLLRDLTTWLRLEFLGTASRSGIIDALVEPATVSVVADRAGLTDVALLEAFLELGVSLGELRRRGGVYEIKGRRARAIAARSADLRGLVEEIVAYDSPIYAGLGEHLRGSPPQDYLHGIGDVIAQASRLMEPVLAPAVAAVAREVEPRRILDVGCGSGVYLRHVLAAAPDASALGIDQDPGAIATARETLAPEIATGRCDVRTMTLDEVGTGRGDPPFDLVLLLNNIYYWPTEERRSVLTRLRSLAPGGTVAVATAVPTGQPASRHLDLALRVTSGSWRLPTAAELRTGLRDAGFARVELVEPVPRTGLFIAIAS